MKKLILLIILCFSCAYVSAQNELSVLKKQLDTLDFGDEAEVLLSEYCQLAYEKSNKNAIAFCLKSRGLFKFNKYEIDASLSDINSAISAYKKLKNNDGLVKSLLIKARIYDNTSRRDSAEYYYKEALEYAKSHDNLFEANYAFGVYYLNINDFSEATVFLEKAMDLARESENKKGIALVLYRLGNMSLYMKEYEKADAKLIESLDLLKNANASKNDIANNLFIIANNYFFQRNLKEALEYYLKALKLYKETNSFSAVGYCQSNIGACYNYLKEFDKSNSYLDSAIVLQKRIGAKKYLASTYGRKSSLSFSKKDFPSAISYTENSLEIYKELKRDKEIYIAYHNLAFLYDTIGQSKKAYKHMLTAFRYKDTVMKNDYHKKLATIETKYQTQQKENEILKLTNENFEKVSSLTKSRYTTFGVLGALLLVLIWGYFLLYKRKQQYQLALLENTVKTSEQEKIRIGKELHDGIASKIMLLVRDSETSQIELSHKLLQTYNEVRTLSHQLDNTPMHNELFFDRVLDIIPDSTHAQTFKFEITPRHLQIKEPQGTHIFRIIQELIANNLKHAKATKTTININFEDDLLKLIYKDNGVVSTNITKGNGYKNMEDRLTLMNGTLQVETQEGLLATFSIPYTN